MRDLLNHWASLKFHNPATILRRLRRLEMEFQDVSMDPKVRTLRTPALKQYREWRDAALFTYGMSCARTIPIYYATEERQDYDFVTSWIDGSVQHFCPVQLKELVPEELNPRASLDALLEKARRGVSHTNTVLAVRLNRQMTLDLSALKPPRLPYREAWLFAPGSADGQEWWLYGDILGAPQHTQFVYPELDEASA